MMNDQKFIPEFHGIGKLLMKKLKINWKSLVWTRSRWFWL